jgi:uncharacterized delta-60 repeat protein
MRRLFPLVAALPLVLVLSVLTASCGGASQQNKPGFVTSWGNDGVVKLDGFQVDQTLEDHSGRILAVGLYEGGFAQVVRLLPNGSLDSSFGKNGIVRWPFHMFVGRYPRDFLGWDLAALLPGGRIVLAGTNNTGSVDNEATLVVSEIDDSGKVIGSFGQDGYFTADKRLYDCPAASVGKHCKRIFYALARKKTTCTRGPAGLATQGGKIVVAAAKFCDPSKLHQIVVLRLNSDGALDSSFGHRGKVTVSGEAPFASSVDPLLALPNGRLVVAGTTRSGGEVQLTGLLKNGNLDPSFGRKGVVFTRVATNSDSIHGLDTLTVGRSGKLSLTGCTNDGPFLARFNSSGKPDYFWIGSPWIPEITGESNYENFGGAFGLNSSPFVEPPHFAQLENGELVGAGALLVRIKPDGTFDASYPPQQVYGAGKLVTFGLLAASDGTVLVTLLKYHVATATYTTYITRYR